VAIGINIPNVYEIHYVFLGAIELYPMGLLSKLCSIAGDPSGKEYTVTAR
jgi:hypothetical protein